MQLLLWKCRRKWEHDALFQRKFEYWHRRENARRHSPIHIWQLQVTSHEWCNDIAFASWLEYEMWSYGYITASEAQFLRILCVGLQSRRLFCKTLMSIVKSFFYRSNSSLQISSLLGIHFHGQDERSTRMRLWKRLIKGTFDGVSPKARNLQPWSGWERQNLWHTACEQVIVSWNIDVWKL